MAYVQLEDQEESKNAYASELLDVEGFHFLTKPDADKAKIDAGKIAQIESHAGYTTATALLAIYGKAIQNKIFGTPVGWSFLQDLRKRLIKMGVSESDLPSIPMTVSFTRQPVQAAEQMVMPEKPKKKKREDEPKPPLAVLSLVVNLMLIAVIIAMFVILNKGETVNMLNYKQKYTNEYSTLKQELQEEMQEKKNELLERERAVAEKERMLGIGNGATQNTEGGGTGND